MSNITQLKDKDGNNIYPISSDKLILDEQGRSIGERLTDHLENHPKGFSGNYNDLTNKPTIPTKLSQLSNDAGYITNADLDTSQNHVHSNMNVLNGITASKVNEWNNKSNFSGSYNDLTNKPNIPSKVSQLSNDAGYITIDDVDTSKDHLHNNMDVLNNITASKVNEWNNKSTFSGNYNDLTNKPTIPSVAGLATETYVNNKVASLVSNAPETLDTLNELAQALGDDPNFATTVSNRIGEKADTSYVNTELAKKADSSSVNTALKAKADTSYVNTELAKKSDVHSHPYKPSSYVPTWSEITNKPSTFAPSTHTHGEYAPVAHTHSNYIQYEVLSGTVSVPTVSILEEE